MSKSYYQAEVANYQTIQTAICSTLMLACQENANETQKQAAVELSDTLMAALKTYSDKLK